MSAAQRQRGRIRPDGAKRVPHWIGAILALSVAAGGLGQEAEITMELPGGATIDMVWIPPGTFLMGSPPGSGRADEKPQHEVAVFL